MDIGAYRPIIGSHAYLCSRLTQGRSDGSLRGYEWQALGLPVRAIYTTGLFAALFGYAI